MSYNIIHQQTPSHNLKALSQHLNFQSIKMFPLPQLKIRAHLFEDDAINQSIKNC